ncbi:MAG: hypothetical protein WCK96_18715 [Methylococcales bacterium]
MTLSRHTLQDLSLKHWTICPSEQEMARIRGGQIEHAATVAYQISNCELLNGSLYKGEVCCFYF